MSNDNKQEIDWDDLEDKALNALNKASNYAQSDTYRENFIESAQVFGTLLSGIAAIRAQRMAEEAHNPFDKKSTQFPGAQKK